MNNAPSRFAVALAAAILLVSGCAVDQKKEIATYRQIIDSDKPVAYECKPGAALTLSQALQLANENEEQLSISGENYLQALIAKDQAFSAFLPTINFSPSESLSTSGLFSTGNSIGGPWSHDFSAGVGGGYSGLNIYSQYNTLKAAEATIEQKKQLVYDLQQTVLLDVIQTYYQALTDEQNVITLTNSVEVQQVNVDYVAAQIRVGTAKQLDLSQAQSTLSQTKVTLNQSMASVRNDRVMLAYLLEEPVEDSKLQDDYDPPEKLDEMATWVDTAEATRQDLKAADDAVVAARRQVEVAFGQYFPALSLNLNYLLYNEAAAGGGPWTGLAALNLPIFTGGLIEAEVRNAWSLFRSSALTEAQLRRTIDQTVKTAFINLELARKQLKELAIEVKAAADALILAQANYEIGAGTELDRLIAQQTLLAAQLTLGTEIYQQKTAYFNLLRTAGLLKLMVPHATTRTAEQEHLQRLATEAVQPQTRP